MRSLPRLPSHSLVFWPFIFRKQKCSLNRTAGLSRELALAAQRALLARWGHLVEYPSNENGAPTKLGGVERKPSLSTTPRPPTVRCAGARL